MVTNAAPVEFSPLPTTREERGRQIAKLGGIRPLGAGYVVPSQSVRADAPPTYLVDLVEQTCTCPDYELRHLVCKHQEAVLFLARVGRHRERRHRADRATEAEAQIEEKARVEALLKALCEGIEQPARKPGARGRDAYSRRDAIFGCVLKVYTTFSGRRADTDITACAERGSIGKAYHPNTLFRAMEAEETTTILVRLIEASAAPLAEIENRAGQFASRGLGVGQVRQGADDRLSSTIPRSRGTGSRTLLLACHTALNALPQNS